MYYIFHLFSFHFFAFSQNNPIKVIHSKIDNIKKNDTLIISGKLNLFGAYNYFFLSNEDKFDYRINASINFSYAGFNLPFSYIFSNGRSYANYNLPSVRTPKFSTLGFSPSYKWLKGHIGNNRSMNFSEFTYQNIRFKGYGFELSPGNLEFKFFDGKLTLSDQNDLNFQNKLDVGYDRSAWGMQMGIKKGNNKLFAELFKSYDIFSPNLNRSVSNKPKANTSLGFHFDVFPYKKYSLSFVYGLSALTLNSFSDTIDILTGSTVYNMLGLYTKTTSSIYRNAIKSSAGIDYKKFNLKLNYINIQKDFRSLGSLLYDNNFKSYTVSSAGNLSKKISYSSEVGIRLDGAIDSLKNSKHLVLNSSFIYNFNDRISFNINFTNLKKTSNLYHQNSVTTYFDSISLAILNTNLSLASSFILDDNKTSILNTMFSYQKSNSIQNDTINSSNPINNNIYSVIYNKKLKKSSLNFTLTFITNKNNFSNSKSIFTNCKFSKELNKKIRFSNTFSYNFLKASYQIRHNILINNGIEYKIGKNTSINANSKINFTNNKDKFTLNNILFDLNFDTKF
ncbi:MAG: hypothetical protein R2771_02430 [Saprospiraceae bacterium]